VTLRLRLRCVFRVAAGPRIGFGHLLRARALARALGVRLLVSLRGGAAARRAAERLGAILLPRGTDACAGADVLIVDDPSLPESRAWAARARRCGVPAVAVHDGGPYAEADLVVDGHLRARPARSSVLAGPRYCLLDPAIVARRSVRRAHGHRLLIALGGGAHVRRVARQLTTEIAGRCPGARIDVAAGFAAGAPPVLRHGRWVGGKSGLATAMAASEVAVVAGGVTLAEACALGVPAVGVAVVAAQRPAIRACARAGAVVDVGGSAGAPGTAARVADVVATLLDDRGRREHLASRARVLVDGRGAERVARRIRQLVRARGGRHG
jgi:spore coat polysaccharide biosynthesis predicted glycosyltransferase SpsG